MAANKSDLAKYLFAQGTNYKAYEYLGAHTEDGGVRFRVWAPNADAVYLVGDFNGWDESVPMKKDDGIDPEVQKLVDERAEARKNKDWKRSDELRDQIKAMGYILEDTAAGQKVRKSGV